MDTSKKSALESTHFFEVLCKDCTVIKEEIIMFDKKLKTLKSKKGFSLVELMVVVAIMGVLSAIAIPAYSEYRKTAKKSAYKTDLTSLHKAWLTFGVELDHFCERESSPRNVNIKHVGMGSLFSSKLYGVKSSTAPNNHDPGNGPGTPNFIGFANANLAGNDCKIDSNFASSPVLVTRPNSGASQNVINVTDNIHTKDKNCRLYISTYKMAVYGHLSGDVSGDYYGAQIQETGVVTEAGTLTSSLSAGQICS